MLINLIRLGMMKKLSLCNSLNGYLNIYKNTDDFSASYWFFNNVNDGKNCNEQGCKIDD